MTLLFWLWGNLDIVQLTGCFFSQAFTMLFGDMHEVVNAGRPASQVNWSMFYYGAMMGLVAWGIMFYEIYRLPDSVDIPWWVWLATGEYMGLFASFPILMWLQYRQ